MARRAWVLFLVGGALPFGCASSKPESRGEAPPPAAAPAPASPAAIPAETLEEIDAFFHRKIPSLQFHCYNAETERTGKKFQGTVTLSMVVQPGGKVTEVRVTKSTIGSPEIEKCLVADVQGWEWPSVPSEAPYQGSIDFKPAY